MSTNNTPNLPEAKFSTGAITATVWKNPSQFGDDFRTVALERKYKDKDGTWKSTNSMKVNDLPKAWLVLQKAYEFIVLKNNGTNAASSFNEHMSTTSYVEEQIA
ncbi:TPA: hypothetical protein HA246_05265 [Candidatus Woesearchaeota archaeon]|nr:hypothetical protein [Candidatus Woesearchaeota archaeon]